MKTLIRSLTLILAAALAVPAADAAVSKAQRRAILVVGEIPAGMPGALVQAWGSPNSLSSEAQAILAPHYEQVHVFQGSNLGFSQLINQIAQIGGQSSVKAIDMFLVTYGTDDKILIGGIKKTGFDFEKNLEHLSTNTRDKLRVMFSTNSFGKSHNANFRNGGFASVAGAKKVCADNRVSLPKFLKEWVAGKSFETAVNAADAAGAVIDAGVIVQTMFVNPVLASSINSNKHISGSATKKITSNP